MGALVWTLLALLSIAVLFLLGALIEMYRGLEQVRTEAGLLDSRARIELDPDEDKLATIKLPAEIAARERSMILIMSDTCGTCQQLAGHLHGSLPEGVWMVLAPRSVEAGAQWLSRQGLTGAPNVYVDYKGSVPLALGIRITPSAIRMRSGNPIVAHTVPSRRRLDEDFKWVREGGRDLPSYGPLHESHELVTGRLEIDYEEARQ